MANVKIETDFVHCCYRQGAAFAGVPSGTRAAHADGGIPRALWRGCDAAGSAIRSIG